MAYKLQRRISSCQTGCLQPVRHPHVIAPFSGHHILHCRPQVALLLKLLEIVIQMVQKNAAACALSIEKLLQALRIQCHVVQEKVDQKGAPSGIFLNPAKKVGIRSNTVPSGEFGCLLSGEGV
jgi:hypothetical protein